MNERRSEHDQPERARWELGENFEVDDLEQKRSEREQGKAQGEQGGRVLCAACYGKYGAEKRNDRQGNEQCFSLKERLDARAES